MKDPDTNNKDAELEQQMTASMHVDNDDVPYPDTDAWHNLGQQTRARATQRGTPRQRILRALMWPAAAAMLAIVLVGLVIMLGNLSDPEALGPSLSIALITTLYGVMFARLLFMPAGSKVQQREDIVRFRNYLVAEGLVLLAEQKSPRFIQDKMNSFLDPALHFDIDTMKDQVKE